MHPNLPYFLYRYRNCHMDGVDKFFPFRDDFLLDFHRFRYEYLPSRVGVTFDNIDDYYIVNYDGEKIPMYIAVPCRKCALCRSKMSNEYAIRCVCETQYSDTCPLFVTLTYNNSNIPKDGLVKEDVQLFLKRLRQRLSLISDKTIRYIACGEYGGNTGRPHYHLILWNFPYMEQFSEIHSIINDAWNYGDWIDDGKKWYYKVGFTMVKRCNFGSIYYVLKYMRKEQVIPPVFKNPTFFLSSRGGRKSSVQGIGSQWIYDNSLFFLSNPDVLTLKVVDKFTGKQFECYLPQYYLDKLLPRWSSMVNVNVPRALDIFLNALSLKNAYEKIYSDKYGDYFSTSNSGLDYKISEVILKYPHRLPCYNFTYCSHADLKRIGRKQVQFWEYSQNNLLLSVLADYLLEDINFSYLDLKHNEEIRKSRQVSLSLLYQNEDLTLDDVKLLEQKTNLKNYIQSLREVF